nr:hypothetical protein Iba_chr09dCG7480 [Ipomoea batatas]
MTKQGWASSASKALHCLKDTGNFLRLPKSHLLMMGFSRLEMLLESMKMDIISFWAVPMLI